MKQLTTLIFAFMLSTIAMAQSNSSARITSGGQSVSNGNMTLSYAIGQVYAPYINRQTNASSTAVNNNSPEQNKIEQFAVNSSSFSVYPNPTTEWLSVRYSAKSSTTMRIQIYDLKGRNMQVTSDTPNEDSSKQIIHRVNVAHLPVGHYILHITSGDNQQKNRSFKFQKN